MDEKRLNAIKKEFEGANEILITSHIRPDGDAVGSLLGLGLALQEAGKKVQMILEDGVPSNFNHLEGIELILESVQRDYDISIVLDCSDLERVGHMFEGHTIPTINIDHHVTNKNFAEINLVETNDPATTVILTKLLRELGFTISRPIADAFLTGLITDTIGFRTNNMTPETLRIAADLMELGADLPNLYRKALLDISCQAARFWGAGLSSLQVEERLLWTTLTLADRKAAGYHGRDDADLINFLSAITGVDIFIIFVEQPDGTVKISWRAREGYDVARIASLFGGGGHKPAAGATITGQMEQVIVDVLNTTRELMDHH